MVLAHMLCVPTPGRALDPAERGPQPANRAWVPSACPWNALMAPSAPPPPLVGHGFEENHLHRPNPLRRFLGGLYRAREAPEQTPTVASRRRARRPSACVCRSCVGADPNLVREQHHNLEAPSGPEDERRHRRGCLRCLPLCHVAVNAQHAVWDLSDLLRLQLTAKRHTQGFKVHNEGVAPASRQYSFKSAMSSHSCHSHVSTHPVASATAPRHRPRTSASRR